MSRIPDERLEEFFDDCFEAEGMYDVLQIHMYTSRGRHEMINTPSHFLEKRENMDKLRRKWKETIPFQMNHSKVT